MTEKQVVVANQLVNYLSNEVVDPAAQTVVFLHGWRSEAAVWRPVMDRLGRRYRQFALDLPGFGKSEKPKHIFTLVDYATVVLGFIKKMELKKIVVVGHSFGGRVVIKLSALEPDIVEKLILVDSAGFRLHGKRNAVLRIVAKMLKPFFMIPGLRTLRLPIYRVMGAEDYLATPELRETFPIWNAVLRIVAKMLKPFFMIPGLRTLRLPIYRVMGAEDYLATPELRETFLNAINED